MSSSPRHAVYTLVLLAACGGGSNGTGPEFEGGVQPPPNGVAQFTVSPLDLDRIPLLVPLGHLAPPGHVLPTDHVYFYQVNFDQRPIQPSTAVLPVYAPATGAVNFMLHQAGDDWKVQFIVTKDFSYYVDHLQPLPTLRVGTIVQAGEQIGTTNPGGSLDLGAYDLRTTRRGFLVPARYPDQSLHCVSPWAYFTEPLRSAMYAKMRRHPAVADKDGQIDFDVAGRLVGNWFEESVPMDQTASGPAGWPKSLAFVFDEVDPRVVRISIGGTVAPPGIWGIPADAPPPSTVAVASGLVAYRSMYTESTTIQYGLMLVQMLADDRVRVEVFVGSQEGSGSFTNAARVYRR